MLSVPQKTMAATISDDQIHAFSEQGYIILREIFSSSETKDLQSWAQEVHDWPVSEDVPWMPYEEINAKGNRVLCRTENFADYHPGFDALLRGPKIMQILHQLADDDMFLFKEKLNYKLAGSGGYAPHLDSQAYTHIKDIKHLTMMIAIDSSTPSNGCLEVVPGSHERHVPIGSDNFLEPSWIASQPWTPVSLQAGEAVIFGSYLAHRSPANTSTLDRRALFATYNCASEGDLREAYYQDRKQEWPATHMMKKDSKYAEGAWIHAIGTPMMSVQLGKQLEV